MIGNIYKFFIISSPMIHKDTEDVLKSSEGLFLIKTVISESGHEKLSKFLEP